MTITNNNNNIINKKHKKVLYIKTEKYNAKERMPE